MKICCVIPLYNHARTVLAVVRQTLAYTENVIVVDDGSTDLPDHFDETLQKMNVCVIHHSVNLGKGQALRSAAAFLKQNGFDYMITIDADGQHHPDDLPLFMDAIRRHPNCFVVGCRNFNTPNVPRSSRIGRNISNFWCQIETGIFCQDTQSGFRAYPVSALTSLHLSEEHYNFEIEVFVKLIWSGYRLVEIPISVTYQEPGKRISHFSPWLDTFRLSMLHTGLVFRQLLPIPHKRLVPKEKRRNVCSFFLHPVKFIRELLCENAVPSGLAASAAVGTYLAVLPLLSLHIVVILYFCIRLKLNKVMALAIQNLFMPPFTPFICIELGYWLIHGEFLSEFTLETCVYHLHHRLLEWLIGSLILAPVFAACSYLLVYVISSAVQKRREE